MDEAGLLNPDAGATDERPDVAAPGFDVEVRVPARQVVRTARLEALVSSTADLLLLLDGRGQVCWVGGSLGRRSGYPESAFRGWRAFGLVHPEDRSRLIDFLARGLRPPADEEGVVRVRAQWANGSWHHLVVRAANRLHDPWIRGLVLTVSDETDLREALTAAGMRAAERLAHQALHDPLTGLPNRSLFMDRLEHAIRRLSRQPGSVAVLFADVDRFKAVNDSLGHEAGDRVLRSLASRLQALLRPGDTVARFGGDEFILLCEGARTDTALAVAERITELSGAASRAASPTGELRVTLSVGVAVTDDARTVAAELLANADSAMYRAKAEGRSRAALYDATMRRAAQGRLETEASLRQALEAGELRLHYQPMVRLSDRSVVGVEALLRWENPRRGLLDPAEFMTVAEESGLIVPIGSWAISTACRQAAHWSRAWASTPLVSVNVSSRQLNEPNFVEEVRRDLEQSGITGGQLSLELTENALMANPEHTVTVLAELKELGVTISVDDFGTGYSSLAQLRRFPIDALKVDRTFVSGLGRDDEAASVVSAILNMANSLRLATVAEGVETAEQAEALSAMGCLLAQGYRFGRPVPPDELEPVS